MTPAIPPHDRWKLWAVAVIAVCLLLPELARSTGSLTIPNTIGAQGGPNVNASLFDANWTQIRDYVNAREPTMDVVANRPAAGTSGRYYIANDTNGVVTTYFDTGTTWVQVAVASLTGTNLVRNLTAANNGAAPLTQYDLAADLVQLRNPATQAVVIRSATVTRTNNTATAGPAVNGRDRSAGFSDSDRFIHLYWIWDGTTLATLSSTCTTTNTAAGCNSNGGPNFPAGYTHWAYCCAIPWGGTFLGTTVRGQTVYYTVASIALSNGAATTATSVSVASQVAANALRWHGNFTMGTGATLHLGLTSTGDFWVHPFVAVAGGSWQLSIPNVSQTLWYWGSVNPTLSVYVSAYTVPNGGE